MAITVSTPVVAATLPEPRTVKVNDRIFVLLGAIQHANAATISGQEATGAATPRYASCTIGDAITSAGSPSATSSP